MEIYLVGGAVRDELLNLPVKERDWVVVGATPEMMLKKGFRQVGKDFPVFLHPETQEEYALARVERKVGRGYTGFAFDASPAVTLEEDLLRRDLTINAIARTVDGQHVVDPYHGRKDIEKKLLRHVSPAFIEDPVRILRVARFAARFSQLGFTLAPETLDFMKNMVNSGEITALVAERVWKEWARALQENNPEQFFQVLEDCGALAVLFPELQKADYQRLQHAARSSADEEIRFAVLLYWLTKAQIKSLCDRYRIPTSYRELALMVAGHANACLQAKALSAKELLNLFQATDAFRREERFKKFLVTCETLAAVKSEAILFGWLIKLSAALKKIDVSNDPDFSGTGKEIGEFIANKRLEIISNFVRE